MISNWSVGIYGVGLIGGSLGQCLRKDHTVREVVGIGRNSQKLERAVDLGAIDRWSMDIAGEAPNLDCLVICTPVDLIPDVVKKSQDYLKHGCIITDVGSTKAHITEKIESQLKEDFCFVGSHPIAGSEKSGVEYAQPDLFSGAVCVVTKTGNTNNDALEKMIYLWKSTNASVIVLDPKIHDKILSRTSHLPHIVAAMLCELVPEWEKYNENFGKFVGTGFLDTTRIAGGNPEMWIDILKHNKEEILDSLKEYSSIINEWISALENEIWIKTENSLKSAQDIRKKLGTE